MSDTDRLDHAMRESAAQLKAAYGDLRSVPSSVRRAVVDHYLGVADKQALYSCDACGKLKPKTEMQSGFVYDCEGTFCHECRHGKDCNECEFDDEEV